MAKKKRTEAFRRELVAAYRRSGMTQRAFAAEQGIPPGTLSSWCYTLAQRDAAKPPGGARRKRRKRAAGGKGDERQRSRRAPKTEGSAPTHSAFLPVRLVEASPRPASTSPYEVVLTKGLLRLPADFDPVRVGALLRAAGVTC